MERRHDSAGVQIVRRTRGYMPHIDGRGLIQFVTFRLADSLPAHVCDAIAAAVAAAPRGHGSAERHRRLEEWMDAGAGACALRDPAAAELVASSLRHFDGVRYRLHAWVVMPNHVHVVVEPFDGHSVGAIVHAWKSYTSRRIGVPVGGRRGPLWSREYWDRYVRNERHFGAACRYVHENPVKARLVAVASEWRWSSAWPGRT